MEALGSHGRDPHALRHPTGDAARRRLGQAAAAHASAGARPRPPGCVLRPVDGRIVSDAVVAAPPPRGLSGMAGQLARPAGHRGHGGVCCRSARWILSGRGELAVALVAVGSPGCRLDSVRLEVAAEHVAGLENRGQHAERQPHGWAARAGALLDAGGRPCRPAAAGATPQRRPLRVDGEAPGRARGARLERLGGDRRSARRARPDQRVGRADASGDLADARQQVSEGAGARL